MENITIIYAGVSLLLIILIYMAWVGWSTKRLIKKAMEDENKIY